MITRYIRTDDYVSPDDLQFLQEIFDELCRRNGVARPSKDADALARSVLRQFKAGTRDRMKFLSITHPATSS